MPLGGPEPAHSRHSGKMFGRKECRSGLLRVGQGRRQRFYHRVLAPSLLGIPYPQLVNPTGTGGGRQRLSVGTVCAQWTSVFGGSPPSTWVLWRAGASDFSFAISSFSRGPSFGQTSGCTESARTGAAGLGRLLLESSPWRRGSLCAPTSGLRLRLCPQGREELKASPSLPSASCSALDLGSAFFPAQLRGAHGSLAAGLGGSGPDK